MSLADFKDVAEAFQAGVTGIGLVVAAAWAFWRYVVQEDKYPHIETTADIVFIGRQEQYWIVELQAILSNKGRVPQRIDTFGFDLRGLLADDPIEHGEQWNGQVYFPHELAAASFLPNTLRFFTIGPGVTAKYSHVARVPLQATFLILHCRFEYLDRPGYSHTMEKTVHAPSGTH